jgi:DNA-binding IclR family transcriptional regulator
MLHKTMEVLRLFTPQRREIGVLEAAELLERPKSTVSRFLGAMHAAGFLERGGDGRYRVSMQVAAIGEMARQSTSLQRSARPVLEALTAATGETSNLSVLADGEAVNVDAAESPRPVMHMGSVGRRFPLHASAAGKVLMAWRPEAEVEAWLAAPLAPCTPATLTTPEAVRAELARVRASGVAVNWTELEPDLVAVASPVRDHRAQVVAALSISAPAPRIPRSALAGVCARVAAAAAHLSRTLGCAEC